MTRTYQTGEPIESTTVTWTTAKGADIDVTLLRWARLNQSGHWVRGREHALMVQARGATVTLMRAEADVTYGYVLRTGSGIIPVPADVRDAVQALMAEDATQRRAAIDRAMAADAEYAAHVAVVRSGH